MAPSRIGAKVELARPPLIDYKPLEIGNIPEMSGISIGPNARKPDVEQQRAEHT
jgi:hypothetical protein